MEALLPGLSSVGNIHPLFVHFPVALLPTALLIEILALWRRDPFLHKMARGLVYLGALAAVVTAVTGEMAMDQLGHDIPGHDLVHIHRYFMLTATVVVVSLAAFVFLTRNLAGVSTIAGAAGLAVVVTLLLLGADRGGRLVFKHGIGVRFVPAEASHHEHGEHEHGAHAKSTGEHTSHSARHTGHGD